MTRLIFAFVIGLMALPVAAQNDASAQALRAANALERASNLLADAQGARNRVKALTETIRAFETGLGAMRAGLRQAAIRESQLSQSLRARDGEVARLLGVMQSMGGNAQPTVLLHPDGAIGTARAGMLLAELTPALNTRADRLRRDLEDVQTLRLLQSDAARRLQEGLTEIQAARAALNQAMAERTDLPTRFSEDPIKTAILIESTETLGGFASGLADIVTDETAPAPATFAGEMGNLAMPVQGLILRKSGEADAAGVARPGIVVATRPRAIVTTPTAATIRYLGPLLDFGQVVILEPGANTLFVLAGLDVVYGEIGQVIAQGTPVGLMGGAAVELGQTPSTDGEGTGVGRTETLYIEIRLQNETQDPTAWFKTDKDG